MRRSISGLITLLLAIVLLAGCGTPQPTGPPPALLFPTSTVIGSSSGSTAGGKTLQILRLAGQVQAVAWSPDGTQIATVTQSTPPRFQVWNAATGQQISTYTDPFASACCLAWSPDGKRILSWAFNPAGGDRNELKIWDAASGELLGEFVSNSATDFYLLRAAAWSPDGTRIAALILTGARANSSDPNAPVQETLQILDAATGQILQTDLLAQTTQAGDQPFKVLAWSPDSKEVAAARLDKTVHIWDITSGKQLLVYRGHHLAVVALAWSPTGRAIASVSGEPEVQVWDPTTGNVFLHYQGHVGNVVALAWSPDGKEIASAGSETVQIWQAPAES